MSTVNTMNTQTSERLARFGRILSVGAKVLTVLSFVAAAICIVGAIIFIFIPEDLIASGLASFGTIRANIFNITASVPISDLIDLPHIQAISGGIKIAIVVLLISACVYSVVSAIILLLLSALFKATAINKTPFLDENVKRLKIIGVILIVAAVLPGLTNLAIALSVFALAYVFQYGTELQRAADETL